MGAIDQYGEPGHAFEVVHRCQEQPEHEMRLMRGDELREHRNIERPIFGLSRFVNSPRCQDRHTEVDGSSSLRVVG